MINRAFLLSDLQSVLRQLEADLIQRSTSPDVPEVGAWLQAEFKKASEAKRTAQNYTDWLNDYATQVAAAWVLSCVFARFLEDNGLYETPMISGLVGHGKPGSDGNDNSHESHNSHSQSPASNRLQRAKDERELYFQRHPAHSDRDYLLHVFQTLRDLKGGVVREVFGGHNPINELPNWLGPDAAGILLRFFQQIDPDTGDIRHDFTDPNWDTRFLGDLYQDLSEAARKKYALLQTPEFVEEFILDRTLDPALDEFGLTPGENLDASAPSENRKLKTENLFKLIDPACGSGHFLLGTFPRILNRWQRKEPSTNVRELVQRTLDSIHGVDINPFAIAIARFRLLLAAMRACGVTRLIDAPAFRLNLVCGDSLLHVPLKSGGTKFTKGQREFDAMVTDADGEVDHAYLSEDLPELKRVLRPNQYHAVVANPPYITPKDAALNEQYRKRFDSCHRQYSLAMPFMEQLFRLAASGGFTGQITANSFMKREFGKKLIESFFPTVDLTHVIDSSGAYIPGHGTPTVILFGRHRPPVGNTLRVVMGIRGEPSTPADPSHGLVWSAIADQLDNPGSRSEFVSVGDSRCDLFYKHPWSIGGGGASELKEQIDALTACRLSDHIGDIGRSTHVGEDDVYFIPQASACRMGLREYVIPFVTGESVRDYQLNADQVSIFPYDRTTAEPMSEIPWQMERHFWRHRQLLRNRLDFGQTVEQRGLRWFDHTMFFPNRYLNFPYIASPNISSHLHFALQPTPSLFNMTAPVILLKPGSPHSDYYRLLAYCNSSLVCFWMKQIAQQKQLTGGDGVRVESLSKVPYQFSTTQVKQIPLPDLNSPQISSLWSRLASLGKSIDDALRAANPRDAFSSTDEPIDSTVWSRVNWAAINSTSKKLRSRAILLQEEIDFTVYAMWDIANPSLLSDALTCVDVNLSAGDRPFEILSAKNEEGFLVPDTIPNEWSTELKDVWQRRMEAIRNSSELGIIEASHYKRRWIGRQGLFNHTRNQDELKNLCEVWLLNRLESYFDFDGRMAVEGQGAEAGGPGESKNSAPPLAAIQLYSLAKLADVAGKDRDFMQVAELYRDNPAFNVLALVEGLVTAEAVPLLPILRYKDSGLRKHEEWEKTWELQRREDAVRDELEEVRRQLTLANNQEDRRRLETKIKELTTSIPVPPKYVSADFISGNHWRLRGKLDVPKERWISFPGAEAEDGSLMICWAGYDHLQQAQAISAWYVEIRDQQGGHNDKRLIPLLACLLELLPWIKQWHNSSDNEFNMAMGDFFEGFIKEESRQLPRPSTEPTELDGEDLFPAAATTITYGWSLPEIQAWKPSAKRPAKRAAKKAAAPKKASKKSAKQDNNNDTQ